MEEQLEQQLIKVYEAVVNNNSISKEALEEVDWLVYEMQKLMIEPMTRKEIKEFLFRTRRVIYPVNGEYLAQTNKDIFDITRESLPFAMYIIDHASEIQQKYIVNQAIEFIGTYADWEEIQLDKSIKRALYVRNYGEEETEALEQSGEIAY